MIPHRHVNLTHSLERVIALTDLNQERYFTLVKSLPSKPELVSSMEQLFYFKNKLNTLSYEIEQQNGKALHFEKELKRVRYN